MHCFIICAIYLFGFEFEELSYFENTSLQVGQVATPGAGQAGGLDRGRIGKLSKLKGKTSRIKGKTSVVNSESCTGARQVSRRVLFRDLLRVGVACSHEVVMSVM